MAIFTYLINGSWDKNPRIFVLELLQQLNWNVNGFQNEVRADFLIGKDLFDYSLLDGGKVKVVIKIISDFKRFNGAEIFEYVKENGIPICVITTGPEWFLYCAELGNSLDKGLFYAFNLDSAPINEVGSRLNDFLSKVNTQNGFAIKRAKEIYANTQEIINVSKLLPKIWDELVTESDSKLMGLLSEEMKVRHSTNIKYTDFKAFFDKYRNKFLICGKEEQLHPSVKIVENSSLDILKGEGKEKLPPSPTNGFLTQDNIIPFIIYILRRNRGRVEKPHVEEKLQKIFEKEWWKEHYQRALTADVPKWRKDYEFARDRARQIHGLIDASERGVWVLSERGWKIDITDALQVVLDRFNFILS